MRIAKESFFTQSATTLAPALVGKVLCRRLNSGKIIKARIVETECYLGNEDSASHAFRGKTERNKIMFEEGAKVYVYLCYGIHYMLNFVSGVQGQPEGVLIRGVEGHIGPGRLSKFLEIDLSLKGESLLSSEKIWLEDDGINLKTKATKRIGINFALEKDRERLWRFVKE